MENGEKVLLEAVAMVQHHGRPPGRRQFVAGRHGQQVAHQPGKAKAGGVSDGGLDESAAHGRRVAVAAVPKTWSPPSRRALCLKDITASRCLGIPDCRKWKGVLDKLD